MAVVALLRALVKHRRALVCHPCSPNYIIAGSGRLLFLASVATRDLAVELGLVTADGRITQAGRDVVTPMEDR